MKNVTNALRPVSAWYKLGIQLGVPEYELKQIEGNFPKDGDRCRGEVLTYWFNNAEEQSWDVLADAVENAGHRNLANKIRGVTPEGIYRYVVLACTQYCLGMLQSLWKLNVYVMISLAYVHKASLQPHSQAFLYCK